MVSVTLENVTKTFSGGKVIAADNVNLTIKDGEFFTLLGPSGCGKTTILRLIAGLYYPDKGHIYFDDVDITEYPPYKRNTGMVFQSYALWPHMTVFDNVAYGLKIRKLPRNEIKRRVKETLELVKLEGLENRMPHQLSGGQQQRVALARALVIEPKVLLLDEPLSNLDAKLRIEMRQELIRIQKELGITTIYVTHDQEEAMTISHRVAIINAGKVKQVGTPREIYERPKSLFVADFIGQCIFISGKIVDVDLNSGYITVTTSSGEKLLGVLTNEEYSVSKNDEVICAIRPEDIYVQKPDIEPFNKLTTKIRHVTFLGKHNQVYLEYHGLAFQLSTNPNVSLEENKNLTIYIPAKETLIFPKEEEELAYEATKIAI